MLLDALRRTTAGPSGDRRRGAGTRGVPALVLALLALAAVQAALATLLPRPARPEVWLIGCTLAVHTAGWLRLRRHQRAAREQLAGEQDRGRVLAALQRAGAEDPATGLANRRRWDAELTVACAEARERGGAVAVLLLDLDHFKRFNDVQGGPAGDAVLREVAGLVGARTRPGDLVARLGGDEFAVLLPGAGEQRAVELADRLRAEVERLCPAGPAGEVTVSVGVAVADGEEAFPLELMAGADAQLYRAKITRNTVAASTACRTAALAGAPAPR